ncbi:MAG: DNA primase catalytic subunit PriS [Methanomicrobiales archaeon]|nr:DNA primase catalytic subunit PriS [Methanomicrobiales archaeon]
MKPATLAFLRQCFYEYFQRGYVIPPPSLDEREWGFIFFDPAYPEIRMCRHMSFGGSRELEDYLRAVVPAHAFHSAAYYARPGAPTMAEKGWTGADLIFDLDADHLMRGPYHLMLARVKEETLKLLDMITGELGFDPRHLQVVFSGGRGYHIHIRDPSVRQWGSQERREMIDYVCGTGIDAKAMLEKKRGETTGWRLRYREALRAYLEWLKSLPLEQAEEHLTTRGTGKKAAAYFRERIEEHLGSLRQGQIGGLLRDRTLRLLLTDENPELLGQIRERGALADEPVTTDTKRLIRMPSSLHGGSGLRVTPLAIRDLGDFDPLIDAVVFGDRGVPVEPSVSLTIQMLGNSYIIEKGKITTVPEALAIFLCCRTMAEIAGGS